MQKRIKSQAQLEAFHASETYKQFISFIIALNEAVHDKLMPYQSSDEGCLVAVALLDELEGWIDQFPPEASKGRFGNPAFRSWLTKLSELQQVELYGDEGMGEWHEYLLHSFGDYQRLDYGTGHETNFVCWLYCLHHLKIISDLTGMVLCIFERYMRLMRRIQSTYWLEPAGSHGVWGLDDYHFLPFLWGSAQLSNHPYLKPKSIHDPDMLAEYGQQSLYLQAIIWVNRVKTAALPWHSPMLNDISAVPTWDRVNTGLIRMYRAEVMGKLPIMQHFLFGTLLPFDCPSSDETEMAVPPVGHVHRGDCCGNPIPSVFAAANQHNKMPFD